MRIARALFSVGLLVVIGMAGRVHAQTTGKIAGTVTDTAGTPLPGVNVVVEGTSKGSATGAKGQYTILGVRPGTYTVKASYVGYSTQRKTGVQVQVDLTTRVNFELRQQSFEGEEVTITAERGGIQKDLTSSEARITSETIENLPVQEIGQVLTAQAGVTTGDGGLHIRGGRSNEVAYYVNGLRVTDAYDGSIAVQVENDAIQELQVISGTFNAEYGQAMTGIVNVVTKQGGDEFEGSLKAYSGSYLVTGEGGADALRGTNREAYPVNQEGLGYLGVDPYSYLPVRPAHYSNLRGSLSGPILGNDLTFYAMGRYFHNDGWLYGAELFQPDGTPGDSSLVSMNPYSKFSGQINVKWELSSALKLNLTGLGSRSRGKDSGGNLSFRWNPNGVPEYEQQGYNASLKLTHTLSSSAFYTLSLANYYKHYERHFAESIGDPRYNALLITNPDFITLGKNDSLAVPKGNGRFLRYGTDLSRFRRTTRSYLASADLNWQIGEHHLVKTGGEARIDQLQRTSYSLVQDPQNPDELVIPNRQTSQYRHFEDVNPITASAYVQDKIEYEDFVVNAGLRFDYFDSRSRVPADPEDPNIFNPFKPINIYNDLNDNGQIDEEERSDDNRKTLEDRQAYWWEDAEPKMQLSPRIGVAYSITASGAIHFSYGHFLQIPTFQYLYNNYDYKMPVTSGSYGPFGNADLEAQRTVMYEIGLQQEIGPVVLDVTGFYRDVRNWVSTPAAPYETAQPGVTYVTYVNRDYSNVRGVTLSTKREIVDNFSFSVDYTYQVAEGSNSGPEQEFFSRQEGAPPTIALAPLAWDQRHTLNVSLFYGGDGWGASTLTRFGSGYPYTPDFGRASDQGPNVIDELPVNSRRRPTTLRVDLYAFKDVKLGGSVTPRFFVQVYNLFDARNPNTVFNDTGLADATINPALNVDPGFYVRPSYYAEPRRLHVGAELKF